MINNILIVLLLLVFSVSTMAIANKTDALVGSEKQTYDDIFNLLKSEKYKQAYEILLTLGNKGDDKAMLAIGNLYYNGKGVQQNYKEAHKWYMKSLNGGNKQVKYILANMYKDGVGVDKAYHIAFDLYLQSAIQTDNPKSMFFTSAMYYHGNGVKRDFKEAYKWSKKAVEKREARAAFLLGLLYLNGQGVKKDLEQAFYYANMSKSLGNKEAPKLIELINKENIKDQIKRAKKK